MRAPAPMGHASVVGDAARKQATDQAKILRGLAERIERGAPELPAALVDELARALDAREEDDLDAIVFEGSAEDAIRFLEGDHADGAIAELRAVGKRCASSG